MDEQSGFTLLQAAVFEEKYNIVLQASGLLDNFVEEMELTKTGKNANEFVGKTAVDFLSLRKRTNPFHPAIKRIYEKLAEDKSGLTELQWATCNDDVEHAVELVLNDCVDVNAQDQTMIGQLCCRGVVHPQVSILRPSLILEPTLMPKQEKEKKLL